jgi:hypothetical protein
MCLTQHVRTDSAELRELLREVDRLEVLLQVTDDPDDFRRAVEKLVSIRERVLNEESPIWVYVHTRHDATPAPSVTYPTWYYLGPTGHDVVWMQEGHTISCEHPEDSDQPNSRTTSPWRY